MVVIGIGLGGAAKSARDGPRPLRLLVIDLA